MRPTRMPLMGSMRVALAALATTLVVACGGSTRATTPPRPAPPTWASPTAIMAPQSAVAGVWIQPNQSPAPVVAEAPAISIPVEAAPSTPVPETDSLTVDLGVTPETDLFTPIPIATAGFDQLVAVDLSSAPPPAASTPTTQPVSVVIIPTIPLDTPQPTQTSAPLPAIVFPAVVASPSRRGHTVASASW
jgi:hypothetical protein